MLPSCSKKFQSVCICEFEEFLKLWSLPHWSGCFAGFGAQGSSRVYFSTLRMCQGISEALLHVKLDLLRTRHRTTYNSQQAFVNPFLDGALCFSFIAIFFGMYKRIWLQDCYGSNIAAPISSNSTST